MKRVNNQNLIDLNLRTEEERKKIAAMGGKAKALKLKQEKAFTEYANKRFYEEEGYKAVFDALYDRVIACADPKSVNQILALVGELPKEEEETQKEIIVRLNGTEGYAV